MFRRKLQAVLMGKWAQTFRAMFAVFAIFIFSTGFLSGCTAMRYADSGPLVAFEYFYHDGGDYHYAVYKNPANEDEVLVSATYGEIKGTVVQGDAAILDHLQQIIAQHSIQKWDGDKNVPFFSSSRLEYYLVAAYENTQICASSNVYGVPEEYADAHEEICTYLAGCVQTLPAAILDEHTASQFHYAGMEMPPSGESRFLIQQYPYTVNKYRLFFGAESFYAEGETEALVDAFIATLSSFYNRYRDAAPIEADGDALAYISILLDTACPALETAKAGYDAMDHSFSLVYYSISSEYSGSDEYRELCEMAYVLLE